MAELLGISARAIIHWKEGDYQPTRDQCETLYSWIAGIQEDGVQMTAVLEKKRNEKKRSNAKTVSFVPNVDDERDLQWLMRFDGTTNKSEILRDALHEYINNRIDRLRELERECLCRERTGEEQ